MKKIRRFLLTVTSTTQTNFRQLMRIRSNNQLLNLETLSYNQLIPDNLDCPIFRTCHKKNLNQIKNQLLTL